MLVGVFKRGFLMDTMSISVVVFLFLVFVFRKRIGEEIKLMSRKEIMKSKEDLIVAFFVPYTWQERTEQMQQHLKLLKETQSKLDDTLIAKRFVDYKAEIKDEEQKIRERLELHGSTDDLWLKTNLSFSTANLYQVYASNTFSIEQLLTFGDILDEHFEKTETYIYSVSLKENQETIAITMSCSDKIDEQICRDFVNDLADNPKGKKIDLEVEVSRENESEIFQYTSSRETSAV